MFELEARTGKIEIQTLHMPWGDIDSFPHFPALHVHLRGAHSNVRTGSYLNDLLLYILPYYHGDGQSHSRSSSSTSGRPGPNSGGSGNVYQQARHGFRFWIMALMLFLSLSSTAGVRVGAGSPPVPEPGIQPGKHGRELHNSKQSFSSTCKRSYRRAVARAEREGGAHYRGRWHTLRDLGGSYLTNADQATGTRQSTSQRNATRTPRASTSRSHHRIRVMTYNVGGLSSDMYDSIMTYLHELPHAQRPHCIMLQETHWHDSLEYQTEGYHVIASSSPRHPKASGVMTLISYDLVPRHQASRIKFEEALHGRELHVRVEEVGLSYDFINVYQKVQSSGPQESQAHAQRRRVWEILGRSLQRVPGRNMLFLAGDMNTRVEEVTGLVGPCLGNDGGRDSDQHMLMDLITQFQLCHLNSWTTRARYTFQGNGSKSHIDHIFTQRHHADPEARQAHSLLLDLGPWRLGGKHYPVVANLARHPRQFKHPTSAPQQHCDRQRMRQALRHEPNMVQRFQECVHAKLMQAPVDADAVDNALKEASSDLSSYAHYHSESLATSGSSGRHQSYVGSLQSFTIMPQLEQVLYLPSLETL